MKGHDRVPKLILIPQISPPNLARRLLYHSLSWGASFTNISRVRLRKHTTSWGVASWLGLLGHLKARKDFGWVLPGRVVSRPRPTRFCNRPHIPFSPTNLARRLLYSGLSWGASFTNISQVRLRKHTTSWGVTSWLGLLGHLKAREDFGWVLPGRVVFGGQPDRSRRERANFDHCKSIASWLIPLPTNPL